MRIGFGFYYTLWDAKLTIWNELFTAYGLKKVFDGHYLATICMYMYVVSASSKFLIAVMKIMTKIFNPYSFFG